ncbi:MAG: phosphodiester glycosidase family protein, partial [Anaerolineales bacterium]
MLLRTGVKKKHSIAIILLAVCALGLAFQPAHGDSGWTPVIPGVDWRDFRLPGPTRAYVTRMDRSNPNITLESGLPWGTLSGERQTVSDMVVHYDQTLSAWRGTWGDRNQVIAAINGSYFDLGTGEPNNGMVLGGWYTKMFSDLGGWSGFAWHYDRSAFVGACVKHPSDGQIFTNLINGDQLPVDGINARVKNNQLVIFTPQFDAFSPGQKNGVEVVVGLYQPLGLRDPDKPTIGTVLSIHQGQGQLPIPFDAVVLSARGTAAESLLRTVREGDVLAFTIQIQHLEANCRTSSPFDWEGTYASIGGTLPFLKEGEVIPFQDAGASQRHPRTAICFNDEWLYFVVVDGRDSAYSRGMTIPELADFCKDTLGASWGVNEDGGGSSTLWLDGQVINRPSDGHERRVANSLMIVALEPMQTSV